MISTDLDKVLAVIPARGGSKGVPRKNIKLLNGKPLIHFTIEAAQGLFKNEQILVSTDDKQIKEVAEQKGISVPFLRPSDLATDQSGTYEVLLHAVNYVESIGWNPKIILLLQPTSPFRTKEHINEALKLYNSELDMVVSVKETKSNPYYVLREEDEKGFLVKSKKSNATRRQDVPKVWELNGAIYIINIESLKQKPIKEYKRVLKYEMDEFSSHDIDSSLDWVIAEEIFKLKI
jgi:N-acylneuraminate cytidylyltransferase